MKREPVLTAATVSGAVSAILALVVAFGVDLSEAQTTSIMGAVGVLAPIVLALLARRRVSPVAPRPKPVPRD